MSSNAGDGRPWNDDEDMLLVRSYTKVFEKEVHHAPGFKTRFVEIFNNKVPAENIRPAA